MEGAAKNELSYQDGFIEGACKAREENYDREQKAYRQGRIDAMNALLPFMVRMESTRTTVISISDINMHLNPDLERLFKK